MLVKKLVIPEYFFSAFWKEAYVKHFDGCGVLVPSTHATSDVCVYHSW